MFLFTRGLLYKFIRYTTKIFVFIFQHMKIYRINQIIIHTPHIHTIVSARAQMQFFFLDILYFFIFPPVGVYSIQINI